MPKTDQHSDLHAITNHVIKGMTRESRGQSAGDIGDNMGFSFQKQIYAPAKRKVEHSSKLFVFSHRRPHVDEMGSIFPAHPTYSELRRYSIGGPHIGEKYHEQEEDHESEEGHGEDHESIMNKKDLRVRSRRNSDLGRRPTRTAWRGTSSLQ